METSVSRKKNATLSLSGGWTSILSPFPGRPIRGDQRNSRAEYPAAARNKKIVLSLVLLLPGFLLPFARLEADTPPVFEKRFPSTYHVVQNVVLRANTLDLSGAQDPEFVLAVPFPRSNEYHEVRNLQVSSGDILFFPETHDGYVRVRFSEPPKSLTISYDIVTYRIFTRWERITSLKPYDTSTDEYRINTRSFGRVDPANGRIDTEAKRLRKQSSSDLDFIRKAYLWEQQTLSWKVTGRYFTIDEIFRNGGGDSGALSTVMIALLRNQGIPARYMTGVKFSDAKVEKHIWVEFYLEGYGWLPADPSFFGGDTIPYMGYYDGRRIFFNLGQEFTVDTGRGSYPVPELQTYTTYYSHRGGQIWGGFDYNSRVTVTPVKVFDETSFFNDPTQIKATVAAAFEIINDRRKDKGLIPLDSTPQLDALAQKMLEHPEAGGDAVKALKVRRAERWNISRLVFMLEPARGAGPYFPNHLIDDANFTKVGLGYRYDGKQHNFYFLFVED